MLVRISINRNQAIRIQQRFGNLASLKWLKKPIKDSAYYMFDSIERNFKAQGRPVRWTPWSLAYKKGTRDKVGYPELILQLAGSIKSTGSNTSPKKNVRVFALRLKRSLSIGRGLSMKRDGFFIGTNVSYARIHQMGGRAGRGGRSNIPARPYVMYQTQDVAIITSLFQNWVNKIGQPKANGQ